MKNNKIINTVKISAFILFVSLGMTSCFSGGYGYYGRPGIGIGVYSRPYYGYRMRTAPAYGYNRNPYHREYHSNRGGRGSSNGRGYGHR